MLTACRRTVREQLDALQQRREPLSRPHHNVPGPAMFLIPPPCTLMVMPNQKRQLQQQIQQVSTRELGIRFTGDNMQTDFWSQDGRSYLVNGDLSSSLDTVDL